MDSLAGRCAEVLAEQDAGTGYGSGLRLATSLVVTAAHVVEGGGSVRVRLYGGAPGEIVVTGRTVWRGARLDVALIELGGDVPLDEVAPMTVGVVPDEADGRLPFTAIGFPRHRSWTDRDTARWRDSDQIDGVIPLGSSVKRGRLLLHQADGRRIEAGDWSGFSGAGVVCEGSAVGVVVESVHSGGLEAARLAAVIGAYQPRAEGEREPEASTAAARELLASHGVVPQPIRGKERRRPAYEAMVGQYAARCVELTGRERELAGLLAFATGPDPYLMIVGGPWAGKTSLVTHFATASHTGLDVVSFVISRRDGQTRVQQFHRALCDQLAALLGEFPPAEPDAAAFLGLWTRAVRIPGRSLLLVVDGLDENDYRALAEPSIASQLPATLGPTAHVLVTSRHFDVPLDVDGSHPLRACRRQALKPVPAATSQLLRARQELDHLLTTPVPRAILTALTIAGGALSSRDIASVVNESTLVIRRSLERELSRIVEPRPGRPTRYTLAHDTLAVAVQEDLEPEESTRTRSAIDDWALVFADAGWPDDTPDYLTEAYPTLLMTEGAGSTLAALASPARRALLRRRTDGDLAALSELSHAATLLAAAPGCDLTLLTRVSLLRRRIQDDNFSLPSTYPLLLVRVGRAEEGIQFARTLQNSYARADALLAIGEHLLDSRPAEARNLIHEAIAVPGRLPSERLPHTVLAALALARHGDPGAADLAREAVTESGGEPGWSVLDIAAALAEIDPPLARRLIEEAIEHADVEDRPDFCGLLAPAFSVLGDLDRLLQHLADLDRDGRKRALLTGCGEYFAVGGRSNVPEVLITAMNDEFAASELVESAPYQAADRAHRLLALPDSASPDLDRVELTCATLAAHGLDPLRTGASDEMLSDAAKSALANGHLALAVSLARDIGAAFARAARLTEIALFLLDSDTPQEAAPLVREAEAALDENRSAPSPTVLAAFAEAADAAGRTDLATPALELAVHTVLQDSDGARATWDAQAVAGSGARLGHLDHVLRIAARFASDRTERIDILLKAAKAIEAHGDHRSADLDFLIAEVAEEVEQSTDPSVTGWRARISREVTSLHLRAGHTETALELARRLPESDLPGRKLELQALLRLQDIPSAISLIRVTARATPVSSPTDLARRQELAAEMIVEMCDAGHGSLCRDVTAQLARNADLSVTPDKGLWARPWLAEACRATGLTDDFARLLDSLQHASLVTGTDSGSSTVPLEALVRLRLWDRYRTEARRLNDVPAEFVLYNLVTAMLAAGLVNEALPVVDDLRDEAASCLALAAAATSPPSVDLVERSLSHGFTEDVIAPLTVLEPACLHEIAFQLGVIRPPADQSSCPLPSSSPPGFPPGRDAPCRTR